MAGNVPKTFTIRAAGNDRKLQKAFVAKFPLNSAAPDLREEGTAWTMVPKEEAEEVKPGCARHPTRRPARRPPAVALPGLNAFLHLPPAFSNLSCCAACMHGWLCSMPASLVLEEQPGEPAFSGQLEGGMRDISASYFLLVRHKHTPHNEFVAVPVDEWYTFKPVNKRQALRWAAACSGPLPCAGAGWAAAAAEFCSDCHLWDPCWAASRGLTCVLYAEASLVRSVPALPPLAPPCLGSQVALAPAVTTGATGVGCSVRRESSS